MPALTWMAVPPAKSSEPAGAEPAAVHPLEHRDEDQEHPHRGEDRPGRELHAVGHGAGDQRRGDHGEHAEEHQHDQVRAAGLTRDAQPLEEGEVEAPDELLVEVRTVGAGDGVPDHRPQHRDREQAPEVHHQHVQDVLRPIHASVEQGQARCHEEDESSGDHHPRCVTCIHLELHWFVGRLDERQVPAVFDQCFRGRCVLTTARSCRVRRTDQRAAADRQAREQRGWTPAAGRRRGPGPPPPRRARSRAGPAVGLDQPEARSPPSRPRGGVALTALTDRSGPVDPHRQRRAGPARSARRPRARRGAPRCGGSRTSTWPRWGPGRTAAWCGSPCSSPVRRAWRSRSGRWRCTPGQPWSRAGGRRLGVAGRGGQGAGCARGTGAEATCYESPTATRRRGGHRRVRRRGGVQERRIWSFTSAHSSVRSAA